MKWLITRLAVVMLGILMLGSVLTFEIDGVLGFSLATLGVLFIGIGLTLKGLIYLFLP